MQTDHIRSPRQSTASPWDGPDDVFDGMAGTWLLERVITSKDTNQGSMPQGSMRGTASFRRLESGWMAYREEGRLLLPKGEAFDAFRDYLYNRVSRGFVVFFPETPPRLFHDIRLCKEATGVLAGEAEHLCGRDHYATRYAFRPDGRFTVHHDVRGPRKLHAITTVYTRADEGALIPLNRPPNA